MRAASLQSCAACTRLNGPNGDIKAFVDVSIADFDHPRLRSWSAGARILKGRFTDDLGFWPDQPTQARKKLTLTQITRCSVDTAADALLRCAWMLFGWISEQAMSIGLHDKYASNQRASAFEMVLWSDFSKSVRADGRDAHASRCTQSAQVQRPYSIPRPSRHGTV